MSNERSQEQLIQEEQYEVPYHYIPSLDQTAGFSQSISWSWGMKYLSGLFLVLDYLEKHGFDSVIDVGCGDGRFLREVNKRFANKKLIGIDYSAQAIRLASAMNPSLEFYCHDVINNKFDRKCDIVTLVEVLEHIPCEGVDSFLEGVASLLIDSGILLLTVPHKNKRLQDKHFQHFTSSSIKSALESRFELLEIFPFDRTSIFDMLALQLLGYNGNNYLVTNRMINNILFNRILKSCMHEQPEAKAGRLLVVARKR